jgi:hypothetical protein
MCYRETQSINIFNYLKQFTLDKPTWSTCNTYSLRAGSHFLNMSHWISRMLLWNYVVFLSYATNSIVKHTQYANSIYITVFHFLKFSCKAVTDSIAALIWPTTNIIYSTKWISSKHSHKVFSGSQLHQDRIMASWLPEKTNCTYAP